MNKLKVNSLPSIYVFDIEGTLLDSDGKIRPGAIEMFTAIKNKTDRKILFESGMNEKEVFSIISKINNELDETCKLTPCVASCCGSRVINEKGELIFSDCISYNDIQNINRILLKYSPSTAIVYRTSTENVICKIEELYTEFDKKLTTEEQNKLNNIYQILYSTHNVPLLCREVGYNELIQMLNKGEVFSLEIAGIDLNNDPALNTKIAKEIAKSTGLKYCLSVTMQLSKQDKFTALVNFVGLEQAKKASYMGDSANDIVCLKKCGHSVSAFAKFKDVVKAGKYAVDTTLLEIIPYIIGEPYNANHLKELRDVCLKQALQRRKK